MQNRLSFELYTMQNDNSFDEATGKTHFDQLDPEDRPSPKLRYLSSRIDVEFIGANPKPEITAEEMLPDYLNYFLAHTPNEGITNVKQFNRITYRNLYPNIDLVLIASPGKNVQQSIAYDFIIHPGGNINDIRYRYHGSSDQMLNNNGMLETGTAQGKIIEMIPESYLVSNSGSKLMPVNVSFSLGKSIVGFQADSYDKKQTLVIDPMLEWATYCGGDSSEEGRGLTTDSLGNVALIGRSNSTFNIATAGAFQEQLAANVDIILEKYDSAGNRIWGTYYGGSADDHGRGLVADPMNNLYLGCHGNSPDGISTPGAYRENYAGGVGDDGYLSYFAADGSRIFGTYYGGTDDETIRRLALDHAGNVVMVGYSFSDSGISTPGVFQPVRAGQSDLCLSKWTPDGQLIWGTYLGGCCEDHGRSVAVDKNDNIYINGSTASDGIATPGVSRTTRADKQDYLLGAITPDAELLWISYWGGAVEDRGRGVFVDSSSHYVYFTGYSASDTGVATPGAYQEHWVSGYDNKGEPYHDMVLMKWTLEGQIVWSTYLGGAKDDRGRAITMIGDNEIYLSGSTESSDTMATPDGFQTVWAGKGDMFLEIFDSNGIRNYGSYFGGPGDEDNLALAIDDKHQHIYLIGTGNSSGLGTAGTAQPVFGGQDDALLVKIEVHLPATLPEASFTYTNIPCSNGEIAFTNTSVSADDYLWNFGDGNTSPAISPVHPYDSIGNYTVTLIATNSSTLVSDTSIMDITVSSTLPVATITAEGPTTFCDGQSVVLNANTGYGYTYKWKNGMSFISGATDPSYTATVSGEYKVVITVSAGCSASSSKLVVTVNPSPAASILEGPALSFCEGNSVVLNANSDSVSYQWLKNDSLISGADSIALMVSESGNYTVIETNSYACMDTSAVTLVTVYASPDALINANGNTILCEGGSVSLNANSGGGLHYQWQLNDTDISGETNQSFTVNEPGNYTVIVTDTIGCTATSNSIIVSVNPNPEVSATSSGSTVCLNDSVTLTGAGAQTYVWLPVNISGESINVSPSIATTYLVTGTDMNGCTGNDSISIQVLPLPFLNLGMDTAVCDSVMFSLDAGSGFSSYLWSGGDTSQIILVSSTGDYGVQVQDTNGCAATDTIHVEFTICNGTEMISEKFTFNLFPNPATGSFILSCSNPLGQKLKAVMENMLSQRVFNILDDESGKQFSKEINIRNLPAGIYSVKISVGNEMIIKKLIIE
ncbi:MAG: PKD domain-containing protein [Chitinophagales bacterium]